MKEKFGWTGMVLVFAAVVAGTVTMPAPLKEIVVTGQNRLGLVGRVESDGGALYREAARMILPERSGLRETKSRNDADVDAAVFRSRQGVDLNKKDMKPAPGMRLPAS